MSNLKDNITGFIQNGHFHAPVAWSQIMIHPTPSRRFFSNRLGESQILNILPTWSAQHLMVCTCMERVFNFHACRLRVRTVAIEEIVDVFEARKNVTCQATSSKAYSSQRYRYAMSVELTGGAEDIDSLLSPKKDLSYEFHYASKHSL